MNVTGIFFEIWGEHFLFFRYYIVFLDNHNYRNCRYCRLMKRLLAISLLFVHLYSLYGHTALYAWCVYRSDKFFNEQISMDKYSLDDLVSVKIPVKMPSIEDWKDYQYISGQVQFQNNSYNYVKLRMTRDTVYLMCIPNYKKTRLITQNIINARKIADIPNGKKEHVPFGKLSTLSDYNCQVTKYLFVTPVATLKTNTASISSGIIEHTLPSPAPPPKC